MVRNPNNFNAFLNGFAKIKELWDPRNTWKYVGFVEKTNENAWRRLMNRCFSPFLDELSMIHFSHFDTEDLGKVWSIRSWCFISDVMLILLLLDLSCSSWINFSSSGFDSA